MIDEIRIFKKIKRKLRNQKNIEFFNINLKQLTINLFKI